MPDKKTPLHQFCDRTVNSIKANSALLQNAVEALPHAFYVIDATSYKIQIANSATKIFGDLDENSTCYSLTHNRTTPCHGKEHQCPLAQVKKSKKPVRLEHVHYDKNNIPRYFEIHGYPIFDEDGDVAQMIEYSLDITDRKNAEKALRTAHHELENRVKERTLELQKANKALRREIKERRQTEKELSYHQQRLQSTVSELSLGAERHRRAIAIDLHDGIGQSLAMTQMKLSEVNNMVKDAEVAEKLQDIYTLLEKTIHATRSLTFDISPPLLYEIGLEAALDWLLERFQKEHNIKSVFYDDASSKEVHEDVRVILYRIVRELLINVAKHAQADNVTVRMDRTDDKIRIQLIDDGIGFDVEQMNRTAKQKQSFGLFSISERLKVLGGTIEIQSQPHKGARILITAPLKSNKKNNST